MGKKQRNRGFSFIEIIVVIAVIAVLSAIAIPTYAKIQERAQRSVALDNAQAIVTCVNAHNKACEADNSIVPITGTYSEGSMILSGIDSEGNAVADIDSMEVFNSICENKISLLSDEDYDIALMYIIILSPSDEFTIREDFDHTT